MQPRRRQGKHRRDLLSASLLADRATLAAAGRAAGARFLDLSAPVIQVETGSVRCCQRPGESPHASARAR